MKRRDFLFAGASAVTTSALVRRGAAQPGAPRPERYPVGEFMLERTASGLIIRHRRNERQPLWESAVDGNFILAESATADIRSFGEPQGAYEIRDHVMAAYERPTIDHIEPAHERATVTGKLSGAHREIDYTLYFEAVSPNHLRFTIKTEGDTAVINRITLRSASSADEGFFGFGEQLTYFNQKGNVLPILVQEHGVGRGRPILTQLLDVMANGGGGNPYVTEAPAPHFISSRLRSLFLERTEYSVFDLRPANHFTIKVWSGVMTGRILYGQTPLDLIEAYTEYAGRMRALPDWINNGAVVGVQGGTSVVRAKLDKLRQADVPLAALWIQDWTGVRVTDVGKQLWWDWRLDETFYPQWRKLVADLESQGGRMLIYINPFLTNTEGHDVLFNEARDKGFLVKKADNTPYLIKNSDFDAGLVDLSNPETRDWIKTIIKDHLIANCGASGWMADFGEALPFDSKLHGGADPAIWHNRFPEAWARVNREAIEEAGRGDDIVFFNRSGFTQSPQYATLCWLGDQLQSWDQFDGIKTAVVGMLSGGVSGFSLLHGDVGGYVTLSVDVFGHKLPIIARSNELFQRWMELAAFTCVFRTHEGLDPGISAQFDSDPANTAHLALCAKIFRGLAPYRRHLVAEAARRGYPVVRHPFLHFSHDPNTHTLRYQFLLGPDLMVAPVLNKGADEVEIYFPADTEWVDLWTGTDVGRAGTWARMPAPLSRPAAFLRKDSPSTEEIRAGLKAAGAL